MPGCPAIELCRGAEEDLRFGTVRLTSESQGLLEAAVEGTGCWGNCNRFQAFKDYSAFS